MKTELILISENKLKIMLSPKDMTRYCFDPEEIGCEDSVTKKAFCSILEEAKRKTGFAPRFDKMTVRIFPSRQGGCEIFISCSGTAQMQCRENRFEIYSFDTMEILLCACDILFKKGYDRDSRAYSCDGKYYLTVAQDSELVSEYGIKISDRKYIYHILEAGEEICGENAVEKLSALK